MAFQDFNFGLGETDNSKTTYNNWYYYSKWIRLLKNSLIRIQSVWNEGLGVLFSELPTDEPIDPWIHGLDGSTLYTDSDATTSDTNYYNSDEARPNTVKEVLDNIYDEGVGGGGGGPTTLAGDVTGESDANTVEKLRGRDVATTIPSDGEALVWSNTNNRWEPGEVASEVVTSVTMGGDVTGESDANTVAKLQGNAVASDAPTDGQTLVWSTSGSEWVPDSAILAGDVTGDHDANTVVKLQGSAVTSDAPSTNDILAWDGSEWATTNLVDKRFPPGYIHGFGLTYTDVDQVTVSKGACKSDDGLADIVLLSDTLMDMDTHLDTGSETGSTWYYVWIFWNPSTETASLKFSIQYPGSGTDPTAPSAGYTKKRYVGSVRNDSGDDLVPFWQSGDNTTRRYVWNKDLVDTRLVNGLSSPEGSWENVDCSAWVSPIATHGVHYVADKALANSFSTSPDSVYWRPAGSTLNNWSWVRNQDSLIHDFPVIGGNVDIEWYISNAGAKNALLMMHVKGYVESLGVSTIASLSTPEAVDVITVNTYPPGHIHGLTLEYVGVEDITVTAGCCKSDDSTTDIALLNDVTINMDDDLDTGIEEIDKWYYIWIFWNPSTESAALKYSLQYPGSGTPPAAPSGYTKKRYIGSVKNASWNFLEFEQFGKGEDRKYYYNDIHSVLPGGTTVPGPTDIDISDYVPVTGITAFGAGQQGQGTDGAAILQAKGQNNHVGLFAVTSSHYGKGIFLELPAGTDQTWQYERINGTTIIVYVYIHGYTESLEVSTIPVPLTPDPGDVITVNTYPPGHIHGLNLEYVGVEDITVTAGCCKSDDSTTDIALLTDTTINMDDDLDTGVEGTSKWYYIWIFWNPDTESASLKFSLQYPGSGTPPTAPSGYTKKRYVGSVRNDSGDNFLNFSQEGDSNYRFYQYNEDRSTTLRIEFKAGPYAYADSVISAATLTPQTANSHYLSSFSIGSSGYTNVRPDGSSLTYFRTTSPDGNTLFFMPCADTRIIEVWGTGTASTVVEVLGYTESLEVSTIPVPLTPTVSDISQAIVLSDYPTGYIHGLNLEYVTTSSIKVLKGCCKSDDGLDDMRLLADTTIIMPTDLDTGIEEIDKWYYVWIFWNPDTESASLKFSLQDPDSGTPPTAPSGYTKKRYVGSVRNDSGDDFLYFTQQGNGVDRIYHYDTRQAQSGNLEPATPTAHSFSTAVPPTSDLMITHAWNIGGATEVRIYLYEYTDLVSPKIITYNNDIVVCDIVLNSSQQLYVHKVLGTAGRGLYVSAVGYKESLSVSTIPVLTAATILDTTTVSLYPPGYMFGLDLEYVSASSIEVKAGACKSYDGAADIALQTDTTIDITTNLDTGSEAASTWYFIWIFLNPSTGNVVLKFSTQAPGSGTPATAPSGFTKRRYIGKVYNDSGSDIVSDMLVHDSHKLQPNYISGIPLAFVTTSTVTVSKGSCRDSTNSIDIHVPDTFTLNITTGGALGLDTHPTTPVANSTWYYVYVIFDTNNEAVSGLLSASPTSPTLPGTYDKYRRVGSVVTDGTADFLEFDQAGNQTERSYQWNIDVGSLFILNGGNSTTWATASNSGVSASNFTPPTATRQRIHCLRLNAFYTMHVRPKNANGIITYSTQTLTKDDTWEANIFVGDDQEIEYKVTNASLDAYIYMRGYTESL